MRFPLLLAAAVGVVAQTVPAYGDDVCVSIKNTTTVEIVFPLDKAYQEERMSYWSTASRARTPSCILFPVNADQVRGVMSTVGQSDSNFAIKGGGTNPNDYFSSIDFGPLISLRKMNHIVLNTETGQVDLGPGALWKDVLQKLEGTGWSLPTPRFGQVGVGGYLLGGGLSFMANQHGWGVSSVMEMQVVLGNGSFAIASPGNHADLFRALRGGGNKYGVVTSFHMQAFKQETVWGGVMVFHRDLYTDRRLATAVRDFAQHNKDQKASIMMTSRRIHEEALDVWLVYAFYDGKQADWTHGVTGLFQNFLFLDPYKNTCRDRTYKDLIDDNDRFVPKDRMSVIGTETIPNPPDVFTHELIVGISDNFRAVCDLINILPGMVCEISFTPLSHLAVNVAQDKGDDLTTIERKVHDRIIVEASFTWYGHNKDDLKAVVRGKEMQERMQELMKNVTDTTWDLSQDMISDGDIKGMYLPLLMNSAGGHQDVYERLRIPAQQFARSMVADYDPTQVFSRAGGFKAPSL